MAVDALNILWEALDGNAYCLIALIPKMIQKMRTYACQMIVVAPGWSGMSWFWDLIELSTKPPLLLPHWETLLKQPSVRGSIKIFNISIFMFGIWIRDQITSKILSQWQRIKAPQRFSSRSASRPFLNHDAKTIRWISKNLLFLQLL